MGCGNMAESAYQEEQIALLEEEIAFLKEKVGALRESRQILMGLLEQQMAAEHNRVYTLEQDIARFKKENLYFKKQTLQRKMIF